MADTPAPLIERLKQAEMRLAESGDTDTAALLGESISHFKIMAHQLVEALEIMTSLSTERDKWKILCATQNDTIKDTIDLLRSRPS